MLEACALGVVDFHAGLCSKQEQTAGGFYLVFRLTVTSNEGSRRTIQKVDEIIRFTIKLFPQKLQYRTCGNTTERADWCSPKVPTKRPAFQVVPTFGHHRQSEAPQTSQPKCGWMQQRSKLNKQVSPCVLCACINAKRRKLHISPVRFSWTFDSEIYALDHLDLVNATPNRSHRLLNSLISIRPLQTNHAFWRLRNAAGHSRYHVAIGKALSKSTLNHPRSILKFTAHRFVLSI